MKYGVQMDIDDRQMRIVHLNGQTVGDGPTVYGPGHSQVPDRMTDLTGDVDAVLTHAPWSLDSFRSVLQYGVLLVEDDAAVQLRHIAGWVAWPIDVAPLSD